MKDLGQLGILEFSWFLDSARLHGFQQGMPLTLQLQPQPIARTAPQLHPCPAQASPPKVFRWGHAPAQVHPLLKLIHGALALGDLVGVGVWG